MNVAIGLIVLGFAASALVACSPFTLLNATVPADGYEVSEGQAYGKHHRQKLDVYRPEAQPSLKRVVIFFYGGSWKRGRRDNYRFVGEALTSRGFVTVLPDYRLYPEVRFPAFVHDAAHAVRWVRDNIAAHGGDPGQIYLMGHSAGAHIAALLTLDERYLSAAGVPKGTVKALVGLAGPYAFDPLRYASTRPIFAGLTNLDDARPVTFADGEAPPILLLHGAKDNTVRPVNSKRLAERLDVLGNHVRYVTYDNIGHVGIVLAMAARFRGRAPVLEDAARFIEGW